MIKREIVLLVFVLFFSSLTEAQISTWKIDSCFTATGEWVSYDILFDFNKPTIRPEAFPYLDSMAAFLLKNDSVVLEVQNHRDSRGSDMYGSNLTQRRAQSVVNYLISKGIDKSRLIAKGYGEAKPLHTDAEIYSKKSKEEQELLHQENRRTVFAIIRK